MQASCQTYLKMCVLQPEVTPRQTEFVLCPLLRKKLGEVQWKLGDRQFRDLNASQLFEIMKCCHASVVWCDFNKIPTVMQSIVKPSYDKLVELYLGDNLIASLEPIVILEAPKLQKLYLNQNHISNVRLLPKLICPKLRDLNLNGNYIVDDSFIASCHFPSLQRLRLGYCRKKQVIVQCHWLIKSHFQPNIQITTPRSKLAPINKKSYCAYIKQQAQKTSKVKDLFKTFQN